MDMQQRAELAVSLKQQGYNCCQAVTAALGDLTDLSPEQLKQLAAGFCVGMGTMEATCGALIGAGMIAGLATGGNRTVQYTKQLSRLFRDKCGAITCMDLKGVKTGEVLCPCPECIRNAVMAYGEVMGL